MGLFDGIATIVGLMVGSGIFSSVVGMQVIAGSPGMCLVLWVMTGILALTGALCYAELGTMIPGSGGEGMYLQRGFGSWATFIFNWTSIALLKPGSVAILAVTTAEYLVMAFVGRLTFISNKWLVKVLAILVCVLVTAAAAISTRFSMRLQGVLTLGKIGALGFVIVSGIYFVVFRDASVVQGNLSRPFANTSAHLPAYSSALSLGLWAFDGWNNLNIIAGSIANPARILPLAIWISVVGVIVLYILTILSYYTILPIAVFETSKTIGIDVGTVILGVFGGIAMSFLVACSTFGAALASMATSSEVVILAVECGQMPRVFARISKRFGTAVYAYLLQGVLACLLVLVSDFDDLVYIYTFPSFLFYGSCVGVLLLMRWREPHALRPYRVWITTPVLFIVSTVLLVTNSMIAKTIPTVASLVVVLLGLPAWYLFVRNPVAEVEHVQVVEEVPVALSSRTDLMKDSVE